MNQTFETKLLLFSLDHKLPIIDIVENSNECIYYLEGEDWKLYIKGFNRNTLETESVCSVVGEQGNLSLSTSKLLNFSELESLLLKFFT